ncbi:hypothetical protein P7C70_g721, partial [Phenoliferia sp. Uapishka_3]
MSQTPNLQPSTPSAPPPAPTTLLATLKAFSTAQQTRADIQRELEDALSSFLSNTPSTLETLPTAVSASTCATEAIRPPNQVELGEVLRIGFTGLLEVQQEVDTLQAVLRVVFKREDLADVLENVEKLEVERLKETIQRDQLRRLAVLAPEEDFNQAIADANKRRGQLAQEINEESREIFAEIAELSAESQS